MKRDLDRMSKTEYDVLIIGGGINGAAIAHDAALRGLKVALVEKKDFGWGTTSATSKLAHGGLRYLKNFELGIVRESLKERRILEKIAPHLVYPIPFLLPLYEGGHNKKSLIRVGMMLYDLLSYDKNFVDYKEQKMPHHKILSPEDVVKAEPTIIKEGLLGAAKYCDCQISSPERLCLEFILTAASNGADVSNYAEVEKIIINNNKAEGVIVKDNTNGKAYTIKSKIVVNASGPWLDRLIKTYNPSHKQKIRGTKGIHIITDKISNNAVVLSAKKTGRSFFVLPWRGHSLVGTTDVDFNGDLDDVYADKKDIADLVAELNEAYGSNVSTEHVWYSYAGVRPLVNEEGKKETEVSRRYEIKEESIQGLITVMGGKLTTARGLAERGVDMIVEKLCKKVQPCRTKETPLYGSTIGHKNYLKKVLSQENADKELLTHLINTYGSKYEDVMKIAGTGANKRLALNQPDIQAQVSYAMEEEMALTLEDFMIRRTGIATLGEPYISCTFAAADIMAGRLGWDEAKKIDEILNFKKKVQRKYYYGL